MENNDRQLKAKFGSSDTYPDATHCDLRWVCGPRFDTFTRADRREERGKFFERGAWKSMTSAVEDHTEHWDGME